MDLEWLHYLVYSRVTLSWEIRDGNLLYLGDDCRSLLADFPNVLRVHIVSGMSRRVEAIVKRNDYAVSRREAMRLLKRIDAKRDRWGRVLHKDGSHHPSGFDLVIDHAVAGNAEVSELVRATAELPGFQTTPESLALIERVTMAAEIRARITLHEDVVDDRVMVHVLDGVIRVGGSVHSKEDMDAIRELLGV